MLERSLITIAAFVVVASCELPNGDTSKKAQALSLSLIQRENRQPGTTDWQLTNPAEERQIEGYASLTSVPVGGDISLFVNTADLTYSLTVFRMGWYGGAGGRKVLGPQTLHGIRQVTPSVDPTKDRIECQWTNPFTIHVPTSWVSGIYLAKLHGNTSGKESYIIFTVRDSRRADLVFQQSVITYQAYNPWPGWTASAGYNGQSLYDFQTKDGKQAEEVSFNRPYGRDAQTPYPDIIYSDQVSSIYGIGAGDFFHNIAPSSMDYSMVRFLEREGYDVTYITDVDTHEDVTRLLRGKGFLSVGHDEYVSQQMKAHTLQARDQGVGLGFFGANYIYWPVDLLPDTRGTPNRTISLAPSNRCVIPPAPTDSPNEPGPCTDDSDCAAGELCAAKRNDYARLLDMNGVSQSEQAVVGAMWDPGHVTLSGDIVVTADAQLDHWVLANTNLHVGDVIPGLIGTEYNATFPDPRFPTPNGLQTLLRTQIVDFRAPGYPLPPDFDGKNWDGWYDSFAAFLQAGGTPDTTCKQDPIPPRNIVPPANYCSNPEPTYPDGTRVDWNMTIYQASSGAWVFNAGTNQWTWGLDDYFTGLKTPDGANNGPPFRKQCGYPWFYPGKVSCRHPAIEQITRNVLDRFISGH